MTDTVKIKSEDQIQAEIVQFYNNSYCLTHHEDRNLIFSVPNGGLRSKIEAMKLKSTGTLPGVSDLIIYHHKKIEELGIITVLNIFVEVKKEKGIHSKEQKEFEGRVAKMGFKYVIVKNLDEFKEMINKL
jgi:hypothetical protein